jgi:hypothetical protein
MIRLAFLIFPLTLLASPITLSYNPQANTSASSEEVAMLKAAYRDRNVIIEDDAAKKVIAENRYLYQNYLKEGKIPEEVRLNFILEFEKQLAYKAIKDQQEKIDIDDTTLKSYYIANPKEFEKPEQINLSIYQLPSFEAGAKAYEALKENLLHVEAYAQDHNFSKHDYNVSLDRMDRNLQPLFKDNTKTAPYILPPQYYHGAYRLFVLHSKEPSGHYSFEESKERIKTILYRKAEKRTKLELLKPFKEAQAQ